MKKKYQCHYLLGVAGCVFLVGSRTRKEIQNLGMETFNNITDTLVSIMMWTRVCYLGHGLDEWVKSVFLIQVLPIWKIVQKWGEGWGRLETSGANHLLRPNNMRCFGRIFSGVVFLQLNTIYLIYVRFSKWSAKIVSCIPPGNTSKSVFQQQNNG